MVARALLAVTAVLVLTWVGVLLRNWEVGHALLTFERAKPTRADRARDLQRLEDADLLNPDSSWRLARAAYHLLTGDPRQASSVAEDLARDEPENIAAWSVLRVATVKSDPSRSATAFAEIRRLDPRAPRRP